MADTIHLSEAPPRRIGRSNPLPAGVLPRGLSRPEAAAYVGIGPTKFDVLVADGRMPPPKRIDGRVVWDRHALDEAFAALPDDDRSEESDANPWENARL